MAFRIAFLASVLLSCAVALVAGNAATSAAVKKEINALLAKKSSYPNYTTFLSYLQIGMNKFKNQDFTPLANTTLLIPSNAAISKMPPKARTNMTLLQQVVPYHICAKKYTAQQLLGGRFPSCTTPKAPPLAPKAYTIFIFRAQPKLQFGPAATTVANKRATVIAKDGQKLYLGKYFNALGVDRVMQPPGVSF